MINSVFILLFFLSGFSGLIYEILWIRDFAFILGNSVYTISAVLSAYMAGLAAGSFAASRYVKRFPRPLILYGFMEMGVAVSGLGVFLLFNGVIKNLGPIGVLNNENFVPILERFLVTLGILLVPTFLMGGTLPCLAQHFYQREEKVGLALGGLYGLNTLGAALGCFFTGFFLIRLLGTKETTFLAVGLNFSIGLAGFLLAWIFRKSYMSTQEKTKQTGKAGPTSLLMSRNYSPAAARFLILAFLLSGYTCLSYEIIYSRFLSFVLGNRVYASSTLITAFLFGIALGSLLVGFLIDRWGGEIRLFSWLEILIGLVTGATVIYFPQLMNFIKGLEKSHGVVAGWPLVQWRFTEAFLILLIPALSFGAIFPSVIKYLKHWETHLSTSTGRAYAFNTLGCILGSLLTGFVVIPWLGAYSAMIVVSVLSILLGHRFLAPAWESSPWWRRALSASLALGIAIGLCWTAWQKKDYPWEREGQKPLFTYEDANGLVTTYPCALGYSLWADDTPLSFPIGPTSRAAQVQKFEAVLSLLVDPDPKDVLVIGLGFGITSGAFAQYDSLQSLETVEIFKGVLKAAPIFKDYNDDVVHAPKSALISGDGRYFLLHTQKLYDIIASNLTGPDLPGSASCYTLEYFKLARQKLKPKGLFLAHVYGRSSDIIFKTLGEVFPHTMGFKAYTNSYFVLCSVEPFDLNKSLVRKRLKENKTFKMEARGAGIFDFEDLKKMRLISEKFIPRLVKDKHIPVNTDIEPVIEYSFDPKEKNLFYSHF
jgi:spermidine synthase